MGWNCLGCSFVSKSMDSVVNDFENVYNYFLPLIFIIYLVPMACEISCAAQFWIVLGFVFDGNLSFSLPDLYKNLT